VTLPRSFKTDESFLEKIAIGATGTRQVFEDLDRQGHQSLELERGSRSFKIWKAIKIKRIRVPDILCLRCGRRVESRTKTKMEISMSHSVSVQERGWDFGLDDNDSIALVHCRRTGSGPLDWSASDLVQYIRVESLRRSWQANEATIQRPKGAQEGFEIRVIWPAAVTSSPGMVEQVTSDAIRYRRASDQRAQSIRLARPNAKLRPLVAPGDQVQANQIVAAVVPVTSRYPCPGGAGVETYVQLAGSTSLSDRYTAVKAIGHFAGPAAVNALLDRAQDPKEHIYVRVDAAAGLIRRNHPAGQEFLSDSLRDPYLENRLEATIVLGEVATAEAARLLIETLGDETQNPEIRAGAAWALGEIGARDSLPALVGSFAALDLVIKIEAARALAKLARAHLEDVLRVFPESEPDERPGIAWALSKAGGFTISQFVPLLRDEDVRHWIAYIIGTQEREAMLPQIETLAQDDPQVYFAVTLLWKIIASWIYGLEEY
jgi:hypothetical protein